MSKLWEKISTGISFVLVATAGVLPGPSPVLRASAQTLGRETSALPDHSRAYYHFMLARRFRELAGIFNRNDLVEQAISEYKQAMDADPDSLFLRVELADLYGRIGRIADAVVVELAVIDRDRAGGVGSAKQAILVDLTGHRVLYEKNADRWAIAETTLDRV